MPHIANKPTPKKKTAVKKPSAKTVKAASDFDYIPTKDIGAAIAKEKTRKKKKSPFRAAAASKMSLKKLESMLRQPATNHITLADFSSTIKFQKSFEEFGEINGVLLLNAKDATKLRSADYRDWFDPTSKVDVLKSGDMGSLFGLRVWTDAFESMSKRFVKNSVFIYIG